MTYDGRCPECGEHVVSYSLYEFYDRLMAQHVLDAHPQVLPLSLSPMPCEPLLNLLVDERIQR
jgi:hypothetical protein